MVPKWKKFGALYTVVVFGLSLLVWHGCQSVEDTSGHTYYRLAPSADDAAETVIKVNEGAGKEVAQTIALVSPVGGAIALALSGIITRLGISYRSNKNKYASLESRNEKIIQGARAAAEVIKVGLKAKPEWDDLKKIMRQAKINGAIMPQEALFKGETIT